MATPAARIEGEFVSISERLLVSPAWGRVSHRRATGDEVKIGDVVALLREGAVEVALQAHVAGTILTWLAHDNERVRPGSAIARIAVNGARRS